MTYGHSGSSPHVSNLPWYTTNIHWQYSINPRSSLKLHILLKFVNLNSPLYPIIYFKLAMEDNLWPYKIWIKPDSTEYVLV